MSDLLRYGRQEGRNRTAGVWEYKPKRSQITMTIDLFAPVSDEVKAGIEAESKHLSAFLGGDFDLVYK